MFLKPSAALEIITKRAVYKMKVLAVGKGMDISILKAEFDKFSQLLCEDHPRCHQTSNESRGGSCQEPKKRRRPDVRDLQV